MAAGPSDDFDIEGALVPLLDLVLQMVMFFMLCANFVMEQVNETIKLPSATAAKSLDAGARDLLYVNVDEAGHLLRTDGDARALTTPPEFKSWFKARYNDMKDTWSRTQAPGDEKFDPLVIIRAHESVKFEKVFLVLSSCREAGFKKLQLRAIMAGGFGDKK